jgi:transposase
MAVLDAFHVVRLGTTTVSEARRRVQQDTLWNRGRKGDPLFSGSRPSSVPGAENLIEMQRARPVAAIETDEAHDEVFVS